VHDNDYICYCCRPSKTCMTPFLIMCRNGDVELAVLYLSYGANINHVNAVRIYLYNVRTSFMTSIIEWRVGPYFGVQ
jgi:ankyrin repeat protein